MKAIHRIVRTVAITLGLSAVILLVGCQQNTTLADNQAQTAQAYAGFCR